MQDNIYYNYIYLDPRKPGDYNYGDLHFDFEPFYVGKGKNNRMYNHLNEIKENTQNPIKFNKIKKILKQGLEPIILKIYENLEETISLENEKFLIKIIGRSNIKLGPLTNITDGGTGGDTLSKHPNRKDICEKMSRERIGKNNGFFGKKHTPNYLSKCSTTVYQYDINSGLLISSYYSSNEAERNTNIFQSSILENCYGYRKTAGNFLWSFHELTNDEFEKKIYGIKNKHKMKCKHIYQCDLEHNIIKEYDSIKHASKELDINGTGISLCCNNKLKTSGGFIWKFK